MKHFGVGDADDDDDSSGGTRRGGATQHQLQDGPPEATWVIQAVVVVTVVAIVAFVTCGCGDAGSGKPVYTAAARDAESPPRATTRAVSPSMQPLAALIHSALHTTADAKKQ